MEYRDVQKIAKDTIRYMKGKIEPGMNLKEVRLLCEETLEPLSLQVMKQRFRFPDESILLRTESSRLMIS